MEYEDHAILHRGVDRAEIARPLERIDRVVGILGEERVAVGKPGRVGQREVHRIVARGEDGRGLIRVARPDIQIVVADIGPDEIDSVPHHVGCVDVSECEGKEVATVEAHSGEVSRFGTRGAISFQVRGLRSYGFQRRTASRTSENPSTRNS